MNGYWLSRENAMLSLIPNGNVNIRYVRDEQGRITDEVVTGSVQRVSKFYYDKSDNIVKEVIATEHKVYTKVYTYESDSVTNVTITVAEKE